MMFDILEGFGNVDIWAIKELELWNDLENGLIKWGIGINTSMGCIFIRKEWLGIIC